MNAQDYLFHWNIGSCIGEANGMRLREILDSIGDLVGPSRWSSKVVLCHVIPRECLFMSLCNALHRENRLLLIELNMFQSVHNDWVGETTTSLKIITVNEYYGTAREF